MAWTNEAYRTIEITDGVDSENSDLADWLALNAEYEGEISTPEPEPTGVKNILYGTQAIDKILFGQSEVSKIYLGQTLVWQAGSEPEPPGPSADPILANNSWDTIAQVCAAGQASNYWALGDTKTDVGTDGVTRTFRICDMQGLYGKNAVFEQVGLTENALVWNAETNTDANNCFNNYDISNMRNTHLPALLANYSLDLQAVITNTTYKVAKNGTQTTVLNLSDKLFLPAEREIFASRSYSVEAEWNALTRFALYALPENDNATFRIKKILSVGSAASQWERSPRSSNSYNVCGVNDSGGADGSRASNSRRIAPCFALGVAPSVQTISFTIAGTTYQAEQGMTWAQWVASAYNTDGYAISGTVIVNSGYTRYVRDQSSTDTIVADTAYLLRTYGGQ